MLTTAKSLRISKIIPSTGNRRWVEIRTVPPTGGRPSPVNKLGDHVREGYRDFAGQRQRPIAGNKRFAAIISRGAVSSWGQTRGILLLRASRYRSPDGIHSSACLFRNRRRWAGLSVPVSTTEGRKPNLDPIIAFRFILTEAASESAWITHLYVSDEEIGKSRDLSGWRA